MLLKQETRNQPHNTILYDPNTAPRRKVTDNRTNRKDEHDSTPDRQWYEPEYNPTPPVNNNPARGNPLLI